MNRKGLFLVPAIQACTKDEGEDLSEYSMFRKHTMALLRYYFRLSMEHGRIPSVLGGAVSRARISHYRMHTLEDDTILLHDLEQCMTNELELEELKLVALTVFLDHTFEESAKLMAISERHVRRMYPEVMNRLTRSFAERGFLTIPELRPAMRKPVRSWRPEMEASASAFGNVSRG